MIALNHLTAWIHWGCAHASDASERRTILNTNVAVPVALLFALLILGICQAAGHPLLARGAWAGAAAILLLPAVPWLNHVGYVVLARWLFALAPPLLLTAILALGQGDLFAVHFCFLPCALAMPLIFPLARWRSILVLFLLDAALFIFFEQGGVAPDPALAALDPAVVLGARILCLGGVLLTLLAVILRAEHAATLNEGRLDALSTTDPLTGLLNRRGFERRFSDMLACLHRDGGVAALVVIDLDNFKPLNDRYGHDVGDMLLREIARRIRGQVREGDAASRFGGDEFVLLFHFPRDDAAQARFHADRIAEKLRAAVAEEYVLSDAREPVVTPIFHRCTVSIAFTLFTSQEGWKEVFRRTDQAMFEAKRQGRNAIVAM